MNLTPVQNLLVHGVRTRANAQRDATVRAAVEAGPDWDHLIRLADWHDVVAPLYQTLVTVCPGNIPDEVRRRLAEAVRGIALRALKLTAELIAVLELLDREGVAAIPYRGPALASMLYGERTLRSAGDLDLLVRRDDIPRALTALQARGYAPADRPTTNGSVPGPFVPDHHRLFRVATSIIVSLRWAMTVGRPAPLDFAELWMRLGAPIPLAGRQVRSLTTEDLLVLLLAHGFKRRWPYLKWVCDVDELVRSRAVDGRLLIERARAWDCETIVGIGLGLAHDVFETPVSGELAELLSCPEISRGVRTFHDTALAEPPDVAVVEDSTSPVRNIPTATAID
jgi:hypothetical protein